MLNPAGTDAQFERSRCAISRGILNFCDLGFRSLKQILDMRVFDLMNMQGLNAVRVEEVIICLYKWLNPNTAIDEAIYKDCNV